MLIDSLVVRALAHELDRRLDGVRLEKIHQPEPDTILLRLYPAPGDCSLAICLDRTLGHVALTRRESKNPPVPPAFCSLLRKYLGGARVRGVRQPGLERILELALTAAWEGQPAAYTLVIELFGHVPNAYLLNADGRILGACRHYQQVERLQGGIYVLPPQPSKPSVLEADRESVERAASEALARGNPKPIVNAFDGAGRGLARLLLERAQSGGADATWTALAVVRASVELGVGAVAYRGPQDAAVFPWMPAAPLPPGCELLSSPSAAVEKLLGEGVQAQLADRLRDRMLSALERRRARLGQRLERALEDQERAGEADRLERWGHLLQANPGAVGPYATSVPLPDLFAPEAPTIEIPLRPGHTMAANAAALFNRARRLRRTAPAARQAEAECRAELERLDQWTRELHRVALSPAPLIALRELETRLQATGLQDGGGSSPARDRRKEKPRFREFRSSDGLRILAGRSARENDALSTRVARRGDLWLHAHETAGAHVVVKLAGAGCPAATLTEAAQIAAHFSPQRYAAKATVAYTLAENVKKPPGAPAGLVTLRTFQTIVVPCDPTLCVRLSGSVASG